MWVGELEVLEICTGADGLPTNPGVASGIFTSFATNTAERNTVGHFQLP